MAGYNLASFLSGVGRRNMYFKYARENSQGILEDGGGRAVMAAS